MLFGCLAIGFFVAAAPGSLDLPASLMSGAQEENKQEEKKQEEEKKEKKQESEESGEAEGDEEKKYSINEVMKLAHKDGLLKKIATGKGNEEDKKQLVVLYKAMAKNKPPVGEEESWKEKSKALIEAAEAAVEGKEGYAEMLSRTSNCKACHDVHKGK